MKPQLILVVEYDELDESMLEGTTTLVENARCYGTVISAKLVNLPSEMILK